MVQLPDPFGQTLIDDLWWSGLPISLAVPVFFTIFLCCLVTKPLTLLNGKALGQPDQYKPTNHRAQSRPMVLILTSSASKILQKFMTPPMAATETTTTAKVGTNLGGGAQNCQWQALKELRFCFYFYFFLLYSYIYFWSSLFWGSFPAFSDACPTCWLSVCLFVCLFGRVCRFLVCFCRVWATLSHCWKPAYDQLNSNNSIGLFRQSFNMQIFAFLT